MAKPTTPAPFRLPFELVSNPSAVLESQRPKWRRALEDQAAQEINYVVNFLPEIRSTFVTPGIVPAIYQWWREAVEKKDPQYLINMLNGTMKTRDFATDFFKKVRKDFIDQSKEGHLLLQNPVWSIFNLLKNAKNQALSSFTFLPGIEKILIEKTKELPALGESTYAEKEVLSKARQPTNNYEVYQQASTQIRKDIDIFPNKQLN